MMIVWDEPKRLANIAKHGLDFEDFERTFDFDGATVQTTQPSRRTGRQRYKLIGWFGDTLIVAAIVSPLGSEALSLISLRRANPSERKLYEQRRS